MQATTITGSAIDVFSRNKNCMGYVFAEETDNYAPAWAYFDYDAIS